MKMRTEDNDGNIVDLLAGRKTVGRTTGDIRYAGHKPSRTFLRRYTGYVEQFGARRQSACPAPARL